MDEMDSRAQSLKDFVEITSSDMVLAAEFLNRSNYNIGQAINEFYEKYAPINAFNSSEVTGSGSRYTQKRKCEEVLCISSDEDEEEEDVVFVSEEKAKKLKITGSDSKPSAGSTSEAKKLKVIGSASKASTGSSSSSRSRSSSSEKENKRKILIDGSNVAMSFSRQKFGKNYKRNKPEAFSVEGLEICIKHFAKMGFEVKAIVPEYRLRNDKSSNCRLINKMKDEGVLIVTPSKSYDDTILLESALRINAAVVSNDFFRDLKGKGFDDVINNRIIRYNVVFNEIILANDPYGRNGPKLKEILYYKK